MRTRRRRAAAVLIGVAALVDPRPSGAAELCLYPPVQAAVSDPFRAPECPYCAGNRGIEYAPAERSAIVAAEAGTVSFSGVVAGVRYVVIDHVSGHRTTYGLLAEATVGVGAGVRRGAPIGYSSSRFFFGLRLGDRYLDPQPHLATLARRPRLVPLDGRNRRPPRPARPVCP